VRRREAAAAVYLFFNSRHGEAVAEGVVQVRGGQAAVGDAPAAEGWPVPVGDPVVDVAGHVVTTVGAGAVGEQADGGGAADGGIEGGVARARAGVAPT